MNIKVQKIHKTILKEADEIFLTSTAGGIIPATSLDGIPVKLNEPGKITKEINDIYWDSHYSGPLIEQVAY